LFSIEKSFNVPETETTFSKREMSGDKRSKTGALKKII
jgi:hypothetical protein